MKVVRHHLLSDNLNLRVKLRYCLPASCHRFAKLSRLTMRSARRGFIVCNHPPERLRPAIGKNNGNHINGWLGIIPVRATPQHGMLRISPIRRPLIAAGLYFTHAHISIISNPISLIKHRTGESPVTSPVTCESESRYPRVRVPLSESPVTRDTISGLSPYSGLSPNNTKSAVCTAPFAALAKP